MTYVHIYLVCLKRWLNLAAYVPSCFLSPEATYPPEKATLVGGGNSKGSQFYQAKILMKHLIYVRRAANQILR
jgi:hypothetical protein